MQDVKEEAKLIGRRIRQRRQERQLSLTDLARLIGQSKANLSGIELGKWFPSHKVLSQLNQLLELDIQITTKLGALGRFQGNRGEIGQKIRVLRVQRGWSQARLPTCRDFR